MEYASGGTVAQAFLHNVSLPLATILPIILPIAALQYLHDRGVVDCDIKPGNILLGPDNEVWLGDSGIATTLTAKSTRTTPYSGRKVLGTPEHLAPE